MFEDPWRYLLPPDERNEPPPPPPPPPRKEEMEVVKETAGDETAGDTPTDKVDEDRTGGVERVNDGEAKVGGEEDGSKKDTVEAGGETVETGAGDEGDKNGGVVAEEVAAAEEEKGQAKKEEVLDEGADTSSNIAIAV